MHYSIAFSGPAGSGVNTAGLLLAQYFSKHGLQVIGDKEYASIIKGDNNIFVVYVSDGQASVTKKLDLYIHFNDFALKKNETIYTIDHLYKVPKDKELYQNTIAFGMACKLLNIPREDGKQLLQDKFGHKPEICTTNINSFNIGYDLHNTVLMDMNQYTQKVQTNKQLLMGNEIISMGANASGCDYYAAYPMTPASSLINYMIKYPETTFFQGEDEIAVAMSMLGAKFTGKRAMCGTSGGGFALMTESISFSNQAELGGVYILAQRAGPSTGTPTFTEQADINFALNASFGDTKPIVLYPSTYEEGYNFIGKALNRSDIYQHPIIVLTDKQFSESYMSIDTDKLIAEPINRGKLENQPTEEFLRYQFTDDGISPYTLPGTENGEFIAPSYEHSESGATTENPDMKIAQTKKRAKKMKTFITQEFNDTFTGYEIINPDATQFFITFGFNRHVIEAAIKDNPDYGLIIIKILQPFDARLKQRLDKQNENIEKLIFIEMNYSGQLQDLVTQTCELHNDQRKEKIEHHRFYASYPIFEENITKVLNE